jgi:hypothetical protein
VVGVKEEGRKEGHRVMAEIEQSRDIEIDTWAMGLR